MEWDFGNMLPELASLVSRCTPEMQTCDIKTFEQLLLGYGNGVQAACFQLHKFLSVTACSFSTPCIAISNTTQQCTARRSQPPTSTTSAETAACFSPNGHDEP